MEPYKPGCRDELKPLAELRMKLNRTCGSPQKVENTYNNQACKQNNGPREIKRPEYRYQEKVNNNVVKTDQAAKNFVRLADRKYREIKHPPLCTANDIKSIYSDGASTISDTKAREYRRHGPRMPYQMWPKKVGEMHDMSIEPERYDTYVRMENEYYRKMHKLARHLWKVTEHIPKRKLERVHRDFQELEETRPQGPARRTNHVEMDLSEIKKHPPAADVMRMHHLWQAMHKLRVKVKKCTDELEPARDFRWHGRITNKATHKGKFGLPMPSSGFTDPSPAPAKTQVIKERAPICRVHDVEYGENDELLKLYQELTDEERTNIRDTCTNLMGMQPEGRLKDFQVTQDFILDVLYHARREAIRSGHCDHYSNYWDTTNLKHFFDWKKFRQLIANGKEEYFNANFEYDNSLKRALNTEDAVENHYCHPFMVAKPEDEILSKPKEEVKEEPEIKEKYRYAKPDSHKRTIESVMEPPRTVPHYIENYPWKPAQKDDYEYNLIKTYYGRSTFWNMVVADETKRKNQAHEVMLKETRKKYIEAEKDDSVKVPSKLAVPHVKLTDSQDPKAPKKTQSELLASWKRARIPPGRLQPNYISEYNKIYVDKKFGKL